MSRVEELFHKAKVSPHNFSFTELCNLAEAVGFEFKRQNGSHLIYKHIYIQGRESRMNFQNYKGKAKPYQIRQLVDFIEQYDLLQRRS